MFLALVPLLLEPFFNLSKKYLKGYSAFIGKLIVAVIWLLFLPNAFYILTDLLYLNPAVLINARGDNQVYAQHYSRYEGLYVLDSLFLLLAAVYGAYAGGQALDNVYTYFSRHMSKILVTLSTAFLIFLTAVGVYIGRFSRWNSWDGLLHPISILNDLTHIISSAERNRLFVVMSAITIFEIISLVYIRHNRNQMNKSVPTII